MAPRRTESRRIATLSCRSSISSSGKVQSYGPKMSSLLAGTTPSISSLLLRRRKVVALWRPHPSLVELRGTTLIIYKSENPKASSNKDSDENFKMYDIVGASEPVTVNDKFHNGFYPFKIQLGIGNKSLYFAAKTKECMIRWVRELNAARIEYGPIGLRLLCTIGAGHFGKVVLAQKRSCWGDEGLLALKEIKLRPDSTLKGALTERHILTNIPPHPFLISLQCCFRHGNYIYYGFDFKRGADLFEHTRRLGINMEISAAKFYVSQTVLALRHLHKHHIVYRDLKPENVLVDEYGNLCLADLGLSKILPSSERTHTICGTRSYLAPEMISPGSNGYGYSVDFWQLGCFLYELFAGRSPFWAPLKRSPKINGDNELTSSRILRGVYSRPRNVDDLSWNLINRLLELQPSRRLGCSATSISHPIIDNDSSLPGWDLVACHDFFTGINWSDIYERKVEPPYAPNCKGLESNFGSKFLDLPPHWGDDDDVINGDYKKLTVLHKNSLQGFAWVKPATQPDFTKESSGRKEAESFVALTDIASVL